MVVLGAGINGCALARELVLNGASVWLIDTGDVAGGTTAYSSRLIHGGLRYLEYGEFDLVRESLGERTLLLRLAPHLVRPLELVVPTRSRAGGLWVSARRFLGLQRATAKARPRGLWLVRLGLWFYDRYAQDPTLPRHRVRGARDPDRIPFHAEKYPWQCAYFDAQVQYPERFVLDLVEDTRRAAQEAGTEFRLFTYHHAALVGTTIEVRRGAAGTDSPVASCAPGAVVNATGAWVDETLRQLDISSPRLLGGTKGSHFFTSHAALRQTLNGRGLYAEASDGRPVFVLPFGTGTLVGTTDLHFTEPPETAVATSEELDYLVGVVNDLLPQTALCRTDIDWHYSGVRPLPNTDGKAAAAITRRHWLEANRRSAVPLYSLIGGKLTTCRSLAEHEAPRLLAHLGLSPRMTSRDRPLPGGAGCPASPSERDALCQTWAQQLRLPAETVVATFALLGMRSLAALAGADPDDQLFGTVLPRALVRWMIEHEWVTTLDDLVERRLMLVFAHPLARRTVTELADLMVSAGKLSAADREGAINHLGLRLRQHFGKQWTE